MRRPALRRGPVIAAVLPGLLLAGTAAAQPTLASTSGFFLDERFEGQRAAPGLGGLDPFAYPFATGPAAAAPAPARNWSVTPSLGLQLLGTDNLNDSVRDRRGEFITTIRPSIDAASNLSQLTGRLAYTPAIRIYAEQRGRDGVDHFFNGRALATLLEDAIYFDLRGFGGLQAIGGGFTPEGSTVTDRRAQAQTASLAASPFLLHRFGNTATLQLGYSLQYAVVDGQAATLAGSSQPFFTAQETTSHQGYAVLRSGPSAGRVGYELRSFGSITEGTGVLAGSSRHLTSAQLRYSLTREVAALVEGGYEEQHYLGTRPFNVAGPVWSVGLRLTPEPGSSVTLTYGRRDGFESFRLDAGLDVGARTRLFATYFEGLSSPTLLAGNLLTQATVDPLGNFVDPGTGAPIISPFGGSLLATQNTLFRQRRATLGAVQTWERDSFSLLFSYDNRTPVTSAVGTQGFAQSGWSLGATWSRQLSPDLNGLLGIQYGRVESAERSGGADDVYAFRASLARELAPGLFGSLQYLFSTRSAPASSDRAFTNVVVLTLRQVF